MSVTKVFINGFESWRETHFEVVDYISQSSDTHGSMSNEAREYGGRIQQYELAEDLTNEFELLHQDDHAEGWITNDYWDEIDTFLAMKEAEHAEEG